MDSFDLLGLDPSPASIQTPTACELTATACAETLPSAAVVANGNGIVGEITTKRYIVRCEARWRIRSAPSLDSRVIGTVGNGTVIIAVDVDSSEPSAREGEQSVISLWVKVCQFEAQDSHDLPDLKRDTATNKDLYCLRRNVLGYGLYSIGVEPVSGPLLMLPDDLSAKLRSEAQQVNADKSEDCAFTWRILDAADSMSRFFAQAAHKGCATESISTGCLRRPDELFELKQREQLNHAAASLRRAVEKIVVRVTANFASDGGVINASLPRELRRRLVKLHFALAASIANVQPLVVVKPTQMDRAPVLMDAATSHLDLPATPCGEILLSEGSISELRSFAELCAKVERSGGWPGFGTELRHEFLAFSQSYSRHLDDYAISLGRAGAVLATLPQASGSASVLCAPANALLDEPSPQGGAVPRPALAPTFVPFLLPPPPPASGVHSANLI